MTNEEKAQEIIGEGCNRQDCHECGGSLSVVEGCVEFRHLKEMAEWKDGIFQGFLFELSLLLTTPKTDIEHAIRLAFPMFGLDAIDEVGDFLREKLWEYEHNGTILKNE